MPNGERLDFVPGGSLTGQGKRQTRTKWIRPQLQREVRMAVSNKKRVKNTIQKKVPKRVELKYADVDISELCWDSVVAVVHGKTLREKLDRIMRKAYTTVVRRAASPVALLSGPCHCSCSPSLLFDASNPSQIPRLTHAESCPRPDSSCPGSAPEAVPMAASPGKVGPPRWLGSLSRKRGSLLLFTEASRVSPAGLESRFPHE